jgi:hypothetical protein
VVGDHMRGCGKGGGYWVGVGVAGRGAHKNGSGVFAKRSQHRMYSCSARNKI